MLLNDFIFIPIIFNVYTLDINILTIAFLIITGYMFYYVRFKIRS